MAVGLSDISGFIRDVASAGAGCLSILGGTYFMYTGFYFTVAEVTTAALGIMAPIGLVVTGATLVGAGVWLAYNKRNNN